ASGVDAWGPSYRDAKETTMPHVIVKLWPGKSTQQKVRLAEKITRDVMDVLNYGEESVSVAFEEVSPEDWAEKVYKPNTEPTLLRAGVVPTFFLGDRGVRERSPRPAPRSLPTPNSCARGVGRRNVARCPNESGRGRECVGLSDEWRLD